MPPTTTARSDSQVKRAVVVGAHGQDGQLLCAGLERDDYVVTRVGRTGARTGDGPVSPVNIHDATAVDRLVDQTDPHEIYYLAAHHHSSEERQADTATLLAESFATHCLSLIHFLDVVRRRKSSTRLFYASSSLVFGLPHKAPQCETTALHPICAYGVTKVAGMNVCRLYRRDHGVYCCSGILFNHESSYRSPRFLTKRIVVRAVDIYLGLERELIIGSLSAQADWGAAVDYVGAMRAMLSLSQPDDFVVATGQLHSVRDFVSVAFSALGLEYDRYVRERPELVQRTIRPVPLVGDASKLKAASDWAPQIRFERMIQDMVQDELAKRR